MNAYAIHTPLESPSPDNKYWHLDAVVYRLLVKAFRDSNRDGYGDFRALIEKLDYIATLGVTCVWFQPARTTPKGSPERDFYVWSDDPNKYAGVRLIFPDIESSNWEWDPVVQQFYWHRFFRHQPDLNFDNPAVLAAVIDIMRFWLRLGVDGMRLDAIPYLVEREGTSCETLPETHDVLKKLRAAMDAEFSDRIFLAEANQSPAEVRSYFGNGDECHMAFHSPVMPRMYMALAQEDRRPVVDIMMKTPPIPPGCQWAIFLRNHDELTLEMVTEHEREFMYGHYAKEMRMRINVGIRRRLAPLMDNGRDEIELMHALLTSLPGSPVLYYGDELGMGDNVCLGDRNGVRTPMQWNGDRNAGFSEADSAALYFPVISDPPYGYQMINVQAEERTSSSLMILCVNNLSRHAQYVELDLQEFTGWSPIELWSGQAFPAVTHRPYLLTLSGRDVLWFQLMPAGAAARLDAAAEVET